MIRTAPRKSPPRPAPRRAAVPPRAPRPRDRWLDTWEYVLRF